MQGVIVTGERLFSSAGRKPVLAQVASRDVRTAISQLHTVLDHSVAAQGEAKLLMLRAAQALPEIKLFRTVPGVGPIGACRFSAYIHPPRRFRSKRKLWKYCRLSHRSSNGKSLRRPRRSLWRWSFEGCLAQSFRRGRAYLQALETTHDAVRAPDHATQDCLDPARHVDHPDSLSG